MDSRPDPTAELPLARLRAAAAAHDETAAAATTLPGLLADHLPTLMGEASNDESSESVELAGLLADAIARCAGHADVERAADAHVEYAPRHRQVRRLAIAMTAAAIRWCDRSGDTKRRAMLLHELTMLRASQRSTTRWLEAWRQAVDATRDLAGQDRPSHLPVLLRLLKLGLDGPISACCRRDDTGEALELGDRVAEEVVDLREEIVDQGAPEALDELASAMFWSLRWRERLSGADEALRLSERYLDRAGRRARLDSVEDLRVLDRVGEWHLGRLQTAGRIDEAVMWHRRILDRHELLLHRNDDYRKATFAGRLNHHGRLLEAAGLPYAAVAYLERAVAVAFGVADVENEHSFAAVLARDLSRALLRLGQVEKAVAASRRYVEGWEKTANGSTLGLTNLVAVLEHHAELLTQAGDLKGAFEATERMVAVLEDSNSDAAEARLPKARRLRAEALRELGWGGE